MAVVSQSMLSTKDSLVQKTCLGCEARAVAIPGVLIATFSLCSSGNRACSSRGLGRPRKPLVGPESLAMARIIPARLPALSNTCYQFTTPLKSLTSLGIVLVGADRFSGLHGILEPTEYLTAAWLSSWLMLVILISIHAFRDR